MTLYIYVPNKEVQTSEIDWITFCQESPDGLVMFDTRYKGSAYQFGINIAGQWNSINWERLPNEFKTQLLLLGVL